MYSSPVGYSSVILIVCAVGACGRIGFDPLSPVGDSPDGSTGNLIDAAVDGSSEVDASMPLPCAFTCSFDFVQQSTDCGSGAITFHLLSPGDPSVLRANMTGMTSLEATIEVCDPVGPVFQIADSSTNGLVKSDTGTTSNDAHLLLRGTDLEFFRNDLGAGGQVVGGFVSASGCSTRTIVVADQTIEAAGLMIMEATALRLDPPADLEGTPDRLWYLGINRTVNTATQDEGSGLSNMTFCLR
jgi:hypothetical protein